MRRETDLEVERGQVALEQGGAFGLIAEEDAYHRYASIRTIGASDAPA